MELNYGLKMQRKWVTLIETSVIVTIWLIVLFSALWKPSRFSSQNPFSLFFLFSKLLGLFCTSAKPISVPGSSSGVEPIWHPVSEKEASSHQTNKWRWPNTWGRWGWYPWLINGKERQACLVLDHWQTEPHQNLEAIDEVMRKQVNFTFDQRERTRDRI